MVWASPPIVSHVGWYGYHRGAQRRPLGTLQQRYDEVRGILADPRLLARVRGEVTDVSLALLPNEGGYTVSTVPEGVAS